MLNLAGVEREREREREREGGREAGGFGEPGRSECKRVQY